jgi:hypothetical protein
MKHLRPCRLPLISTQILLAPQDGLDGEEEQRAKQISPT